MHPRRLFRRGVLAVLLASALPAAGVQTVMVAGTGSATGGVRMLAEAFNAGRTDFHVVVRPAIGSSGAVKAVMAGALDIALTSSELTEGERAAGMRQTKYASSPLVFATRKDNPVESLTTRDLADLYAGRRATWGNGTIVRLVLRPPQDIDSRMVMGIAPAVREALSLAFTRPGMVTAKTDTDAADAIEKLPGSLGLITLAQAQSERRSVRILALDGTSVRADGTADGRYALFKSFSLVTSATPSAGAASFIEFARSAAGQSILARSGHLLP